MTKALNHDYSEPFLLEILRHQLNNATPQLGEMLAAL